MTSPKIDAARLTLALNELRLPTIKTLWPSFAAQADKEGWRRDRFVRRSWEIQCAQLPSR